MATVNERNEAMLAMKEQLRQIEAFRLRNSDNEEFQDSGMVQLGKRIADQLSRLIRGLPPDESPEQQKELDARLDSMTSDSDGTDDSPSLIMMLRSREEAQLRGLPPTAQFLVFDAERAAAEGASKETWILEVLTGHRLDEFAQLGCMRHIVTLWTGGPWPWPRDLEMQVVERRG